MSEARTVILFHGNCPDGFGGAYSAWKKFGESAEYVPLKHGKPVPVDLTGAHAYFIDFCYPADIMAEIASVAASVTVLDHHEGMKEVVEALPSHVYDVSHSGAVIAWMYFHPDTPIPTLLSYVEEGDLYRFELPDARALLSYVYSKPFEFTVWDELVAQVEDEKTRAVMIERGTIYAEHSTLLVDELIEDAKLVRFEGYECYFSPSISVFTSDLGNRLARKRAPLSLSVQARPDGIRVSLRGDGTVDVAKIAQKYGGNGHPNASAFSLAYGAPIPWEIVDEDPRG